MHSSDAVVLQTPMICHTCRECLLRVMELDKGTDDVLCLSCGGFGNTRDVQQGSRLIGQAFDRGELNRMQERVNATMQEYRLNAL